MKRAAAAAAVALALAPAGLRAGDEVTVQVAVDKARPAADEMVRLTYTFTGPGLSGASHVPSIPLKNLAVAGGPFRSDQVSYVNGVFSRTLSITYVLRPLGPGPAEIGEVTFGFGEKTAKAASYLLEVGPARPAGAQRAAPQEQEPEDPLGQFFRRRDAAVNPRAERSAARPFVEYRVTADKTTAYVGEEITLSYELLTQADVQGLEYLDAPKFPGLWAEDLEKPERPEGRRGVVDGRTVMRFTLLKKAVSGLTPGNVTVPESRIRTSVRVGPDPFGDPFGFFPRPQVMDLVAKPVALKILPVPGRPDFKGPVGRFDLTTTEWSWVLVPTAKGALTIPPVSVEVFDPVEKRVVAKTTQPIALVAEGGAPGTDLASAAPSSGAAETTLPGAPPAPTSAAPPPTPALAAVADLSTRRVHGPIQRKETGRPP